MFPSYRGGSIMTDRRKLLVRGVFQLTVVLTFAFWIAGPLSISAQDEAQNPGYRRATFAGGCFWCMEPPYDKLDGVISTTSGYAGGHTENPTYRQVSAGVTGHAEVVQIIYDPERISYGELLDVFWRNVDPLDSGGQFCDRGDQYRTAIFYHDEQQKRLAEQSKAALDRSGSLTRSIVTEIVPLNDDFYAAEEYHQDYYIKNPLRYKYYRTACGRDRRLEQLWGED
jgi:peptide-methionine (S)-S-oxide reductase